jgi:hypothetical protein
MAEKGRSATPLSKKLDAVQGIGLGAGPADNRSCAIDGDRQAVRFVRRRVDRARR